MLTTAQRKVCVCRRAEGVANNEEGDIPGVGVGQDGIGVGLDGLAVGEDDRAAIVGFLQLLLVDEQDSRVGFEIYTFGPADYIQTLD